MSALLASPRVFGTTILAAMIALTASTAGAADQTKFELFTKVQDQVLRYSFFTVFDDVNIAIEDDGTVTLTGSVPLGTKRRRSRSVWPSSTASPT